MRLILLCGLLVLPAMVFAGDMQGRTEADVIEELGIPSDRMVSKEGEYFQYSSCKKGNLTMPLQGVGYMHSPEVCKRRVLLLKDGIVARDFGTKYNPD